MAADRDAELEWLHAKIGERGVELVFFSQGLRTISVARRRDDRAGACAAVDHAAAPAHLNQPVASYGPGRGKSPLDLVRMRLIDQQFLETAWYGSGQMARHLRRQGHVVGRKRVRRLMATMRHGAVCQRSKGTVRGARSSRAPTG